MTVKKIIAIVLAVVLTVGAGVTALLVIRNNSDPVKVYAVTDFAMTDYWGAATESYGYVTADKLQEVYVSDTQTITEIYVTQGQSVKTGDKLLSYDTTLTDLQLTRKEIDVKKAQLALENAKDELAEINQLKPYVEPTPTPSPTPTPTPEPEDPYVPPIQIKGSGTAADPYIWAWGNTCVFTQEFMESILGTSDTVYAVFRVYKDNMPSGEILSSWNVMFVKTVDGIEFSMFDWVDTGDTGDTVEPTDNSTEVPVSEGGYTAAEIAKMKADKQQEIRDLDLALRMVQVEYAQLSAEISDGIVLAKCDGVVTEVNDASTAKSEGTPVVRLSGGGGYYVTCSMSEYDLETVAVGQTVTVSSLETGSSFEGTITAISEYPTTSGYYYGSGNTNTSTYPFTVYVDESAGFKEGEYVSVSYTASQSSEGFYLQTMFVLTENGKSYVYVRNEAGLLEQREITAGMSLYGSYIQVLGGLTLDDYVAFPYGKDIRDGAKTVEASAEDLYGY